MRALPKWRNVSSSSRVLIRWATLALSCIAVVLTVARLYSVRPKAVRSPPTISLPLPVRSQDEHILKEGSDFVVSWQQPDKTQAAHVTDDFQSVLRPLILKVMMITSWDQSAYERALRLQETHGQRHGYRTKLLRQPILNDVWSKPAYILSVLLAEMAKPVGERAQWLFWFDADVILLNPKIPLDVFLPPATFDDINLLVGFDWNGLNNGVYPLRVHPWSIELLTTILAFPILRPDEPLPLRDQTAMAEVLKIPRFAKHTAVVPLRWFNSYHRTFNESTEHMKVQPGDLLVHLAGVPDRFAIMEHYLRLAQSHRPEYEVELGETSLVGETRQFWNDFGVEREELSHQIEELRSEGDKIEKICRKYLSDTGGALYQTSSEAVERLYAAFEVKKKVFENFYMKQDLTSVSNAVEATKVSCVLLKDLFDSKELVDNAV